MVKFLRQSSLSLLVVFLAGWFSSGQVVAGLLPSRVLNIPMDQRVVDLTGTLDSATQARLTEQLAALEQRKGSQIAVLLVPSTDDDSIEDFANQRFRAWKLGRKDVDDGILLLVAKDDRKVRIEVGYGLEGTVTDLLSHRIIEEHIKPAFLQGDYAGGVQLAVDDLILLVDGGALPNVSRGALPLVAYMVFLALIIGAVGGVLVAAGKLQLRRAVIAGALVTVILAVAVGGKEWQPYVVALPFAMFIGGAMFGALWQARAAFYCVLGLLGYITGLVLVDRRVTDVSFLHWLVFPLAGLLVLGLYLLLFSMMRATWKKSRRLFMSRLASMAVVYLVAGWTNGAELFGWLLALPISSFAGFFIFTDSIRRTGSGSSGGSGSSSSSSSSSSSGGGFSGGGGSSGGGGASGSW